MAVWARALAAAVATWRLTARYLAGRVFPLEASVAPMRIVGFALIAAALKIVLRPAIRTLLSPGPWLDP